MTIEEIYDKYGEPFYIGSKHMVWKAPDLQRAIKVTKPGYLSDGSSIITSQPWHEPADPSSPHPSDPEMRECLQRFGFAQVSSHDWKNAEGIVARNVRPQDFIKTKVELFLLTSALKGLARRTECCATVYRTKQSFM